MRHTLFISDLHLDEAHTRSLQIFFNFLENHAKYADEIYILGDFFEIWLGDDDPSHFVSRIKGSLRHLTSQGIKIHVMQGNRDFLLGKRFAKDTGAKLLPEFTRIELYGRPLLLTHGDALCTLDEQHMRLRKYTQNRLVQLGLRWLPLAIRKKIAQYLRQRSRYETSNKVLEKMDVVPHEVVSIMQQYEVAHLIHGHTHRPAVVNYSAHKPQLERIVLGSWEHQGCVLKWFENHKRDMVFFN